MAQFRVVVEISAGAEWRALKPLLPHGALIGRSPYGETAVVPVAGEDVLFFHGGWGKVAAAGATQYAIDAWQPRILANLGTCGGFAGCIQRGDIVLAERTLIYDIIEQMGDPQAAIDAYATALDLSWLPAQDPIAVTRALLVSADRDLLASEVDGLRERYGASAGDWESGAIAWVCARSAVKCLILRGVTDLVGASGGEAYANYAFFEAQTALIMRRLYASLPGWLL